MNNTIVWNDGLNNYRHHQISFQNTQILYHCHLDDDPTSTNNLDTAISQILETFCSQPIELLYSGGLDSELLLVKLKKLNYPVQAITMKLYCRGYPVNTHDLYYSEKFCRQHDITQKFIELDIEQFFESGRYLDYLTKYYIQEPHVATHFWMFEQCDKFPVLAGEYTWPWVSVPILSPHRLEYSCYDRYLADHGITGIGNFLNYSYDINTAMISTHCAVFKQHNFMLDNRNLPVFKKKFYDQISDHDFEIRMRNSGWENLPRSVFNKNRYRLELIQQYRQVVKSSISWSKNLADMLGGEIYCNDRYN
jgi:hypothetical protein